ncbi:hypothetical protein UY3_18899 [Chelonia mydas]|uniref:Uncharacterized protein n=1 Tax=Chelonia mydas TaxID=8469 RepID=M7AGJ9_CHEMY|nr:hypothetical protein UY3_18899 [Chelonia mydas]
MPILTALVSSSNSTTLQPAKVKELRHVYQKAREANHHFGAAVLIRSWMLSSAATPLPPPKSPMDTSMGLELAESGPNPENEVIDEEVEVDDNVEHTVGSPGDMAFKGIPYTPAECFHQIRKHPRWSKEDMFQEVLQYSDAEKREHRQ